jgi:hypothetical protein
MEVVIKYGPLAMMIVVALIPAVAGLVLVWRASRQYKKGLAALTDPKSY